MHFVFTTLGYHPDNIGGAFRYVAELAEGLARRGHEVDVAYPSIDGYGPREAAERRNGVNLHRFRTPRGAFWRNWLDRNNAMRGVLKSIRQDDPEALIVSCHAYFARAVASAGGKVVSLFTGPWAEEFLQSNVLGSQPLAREKLIAPALRKVEFNGLSRSLAIFTISQYYLRQLPQWHPKLARPVHVIEGGVNLDQFRPVPEPERAALRTRLGVGVNDFLFITVRRLEPRMGLLGLAESFAAGARDFPNAHLWIGGTGSQQAALEDRIRALNLSEHVRLCGFIPEADLASHYAAADCAIMPSLDLEGFGLATVEALACGAPVIGSRHGATPEILEPLDPNLIYNTPGDLAEKLRAVLADPASLPTRPQCRAYAEARYSWARPVAAFEGQCRRIQESSP